MKQNNRNGLVASNLNGMLIYQEKKRTVYYDIFTKKGYIITNLDVRTYLIYSTRYSLFALLGFFLYYLTNAIEISFLIPIMLLLVAEILFRTTYLYRLTSIKNYERPKKAGYIEETANNESYIKIVLLIVLGILLAIMIGNNMNNGLYKTRILVIMAYIVTYGALFIALLNIVALYKKIKSNK